MVGKPFYVPFDKLKFVRSEQVEELFFCKRNEDGVPEEPGTVENLTFEELFRAKWKALGASQKQQDRLWRNYIAGGCNAPRYQWKSFVDDVMGWRDAGTN